MFVLRERNYLGKQFVSTFKVLKHLFITFLEWGFAKRENSVLLLFNEKEILWQTKKQQN